MNACLLRLYIRGFSGRFMRVTDQVRKMCDATLGPRYRLEVVDLQEAPHLAQQLNIFMVPTLIKDEPDPPRRFVGSFDNTERLQKFLLELAESA